MPVLALNSVAVANPQFAVVVGKSLDSHQSHASEQLPAVAQQINIPSIPSQDLPLKRPPDPKPESTPVPPP
ncbi:MAG TPA: hypothetical protein DEV81_17950, partial [Cyanobacteria bacterium UBA11049]|nr:hypothetical protein [Cyanobacteria bacterium UBA11049]